MSERAPRVSVIVCTRDRAALLRRCLRSLLEDTSTSQREVIVVDNGSRDGTREVVGAASAGTSESVRYLVEPRAGKSHALNTAVAAAAGEFLLFTDDDVEVEPGWTDAMMTALAAPGVVAAGGRTVPDWEVAPPAWVDATLERDLGVRDLGLERRALEPDDVIGANLGMRAGAIKANPAPFDSRLGPRGRLKVDYEEFDLLRRLARSGTIAYAPDAVVRHHVPATRATWRWMRRTYFQRGFGKARLERGDGAASPSWIRRLRLCRHNYFVARRLRRRNIDEPPTPATAAAEFHAYLDLGHDIDMLLARLPRVATWTAGLPL